MKIRIMLIIAITALSLLFITGGIRQANAYNILVGAGFEQIEKDKKVAADSAETIARVEPAAG